MCVIAVLLLLASPKKVVENDALCSGVRCLVFVDRANLFEYPFVNSSSFDLLRCYVPYVNYAAPSETTGSPLARLSDTVPVKVERKVSASLVWMWMSDPKFYITLYTKLKKEMHGI